MSEILKKMPYYIETNTLIAPFWEGLNEGIFKTTQCVKCQEIHFPPRTLCPACFGNEMHWIELPLEGTIQTFTSVLIPPPGFDGAYILAQVLVDKLNKPILGRLLSDSEPNVGDRIEIGFESVEGQSVIIFKPKQN